MDNWPSVTIIVVNYNGLEHLKECFSTLVQLDYPLDHLSLMLVDNASIDGSVNYIQEHYPQVRLILNEKNLGFGGGNNRGARAASSQYLLFLNADMRVDPQLINQLIKIIQSNPDAICLGAKILSWDGSHLDFGGAAADYAAHAYQLGLGEPSNTSHYNRVEPILFACGGAMLIDRQIFLDVGGFDENYFLFYEDLDLGWRLWILGYQVYYAPQAIVYHHHHGAVSVLPEIRKWALFKRNALYTIMKNYDQVNMGNAFAATLLCSMAGIANQSIQHICISSLSVEEQNAGTLAAIYEVVERIPELIELRSRIQNNRHRSDEEITRLFHWPFRYWPEIGLRPQYPITEVFQLQQTFKHLPRRVLIISPEKNNSSCEYNGDNDYHLTRGEMLCEALKGYGHTVVLSKYVPTTEYQEDEYHTSDIGNDLFTWNENTLLVVIQSVNPDIIIVGDWTILQQISAEQIDYPIILDQDIPIGQWENDLLQKIDILHRIDLLIYRDESIRNEIIKLLSHAAWTNRDCKTNLAFVPVDCNSKSVIPLNNFIRSPHLRQLKSESESSAITRVVNKLQQKDRNLNLLTNQVQSLSNHLAEETSAYEDQLKTLENRLGEYRLQLNNRNRVVAERDIALVEKDQVLAEITSSRVWRLITRFRSIRLKIIPRGSKLEKILHLEPHKLS